MSHKPVKYAVMTTLDIAMRSFGVPLARELTHRGIETTIICRMSSEFLNTYSQEFNCVPIDIKRGFCPLNLIKTIFCLVRIFRKYRFDMVQYGTENMAFCASIAAWLTRIPVRIYEHWGARYVGYSGIMRAISRFIEKTAARFSTDVRQVSQRNMQICIADGIYQQEKVAVLGRGGTVGVDFSQFDLNKKTEHRAQIRCQYNIPKDAILFGFVGRIQVDKGANELIEAFQHVYARNANAHLLMVGGMDAANPVEEQNLSWAQECPHVHFVGYVTDVDRYMSSFDIMVHPTYREGFGMVLQEAAALKIPIITTDIIGPGEYIIHGKTGILVEAKNRSALAEAMEELSCNKEKRESLADCNYEYTKTFFERSVMLARIVADRLELLAKLTA